MALREYQRTGELWGPSPDEVLPEGHLARVVDEFVERIGVGRLNRKFEQTAGEPAYDLRLLCKVLIYAYGRGITSSREMARQCEESLGFRYLTCNQMPDHRTLSRFRRKYRRLLRWVFGRTVRLGRKMGLVRLGLIALDSVKLAADAKASSKRTREELREEVRKLDEYLEAVERQDRADDTRYGEDSREDTLPKDLRRAERRRKKLAEALECLEKDRREQMAAGKRRIRRDVIPSDPEAVWVKKQGRIIPGYSAEVAADESGMVVAVKATRAQDDREQLAPMIGQIERTAGEPARKLVADNGYYSEAGVVEAEKTSTQVLVPEGRMAGQVNREGEIQQPDKYHVDAFGYDEQEKSFICPGGQKLEVLKHHKRRGLPTIIYRGTHCGDCAARAECTRDRQGYRTVEVHEQYGIIRRAHERFRSAEGQRLYRKRKTISEPVFGQWQYNRGVRRLRLRRLSGFDIELHLLAIGHNVRKFWKREVKFNGN